MTVTIRRADIARKLIHLGHNVVDIHKDKEFPSTNFVFAHDDTLSDDFKKVLNDLKLEDDVPTKRTSSDREPNRKSSNRKYHRRDNEKSSDKESSRGGYSRNTIVEKAE